VSEVVGLETAMDFDRYTIILQKLNKWWNAYWLKQESTERRSKKKEDQLRRNED
jgi:hypothetical protein